MGRRGELGFKSSTQQFLNIKVVTIDWLRQCFVKQEMVDSDLFKAMHTLISSDKQQQLAKKQRQKQVFKINIFNGKTFRIVAESFERDDMDEAMHIISNLEKKILEYGGRLIDDASFDAMFLVQEDGYQRDIWSAGQGEEEESDKKKQKIVHERFIDECIKEKTMLNAADALHLQPLPHKVPIKNFSKACVQLALVESRIDGLVMEKLIDLYGFRSGWQQGVTTHLVLMSTE